RSRPGTTTRRPLTRRPDAPAARPGCAAAGAALRFPPGATALAGAAATAPVPAARSRPSAAVTARTRPVPPGAPRRDRPGTAARGSTGSTLTSDVLAVGARLLSGPSPGWRPPAGYGVRSRVPRAGHAVVAAIPRPV